MCTLFIAILTISTGASALNLTTSKLADQYDELLLTMEDYLSRSNSHPSTNVQSTNGTFKHARIPYDANLTSFAFHTLYESTSTPVVVTAPSASTQNNASTSTPVVVTAPSASSTPNYWSRSNSTWNSKWWIENCGETLVKLRIGETNMPLWQWRFTDVPLSEYIHFMEKSISQLHLTDGTIVYHPNQTYLFDFPMALCPSTVLDDFILPKWFANDLLSLCKDVNGKACPYAEIDWPSVSIQSDAVSKYSCNYR